MTEPIKHARACNRTHFECRCGEYRIPFGKFRNRYLKDVWNTDGGSSYLVWFSENMRHEYPVVYDWIDSFLSMQKDRP